MSLLLPRKPNLITNKSILIQAFQVIKTEIALDTASREKVTSTLREVQEHSRHSIHHYLTGNHEVAYEHLSNCKVHASNLFKELKVAPLFMRESGYITEAIGQYVEAESFYYFFKEGRLVHISECAEGIEDNEYLVGVISYCSSLARYAVERARNSDTVSIKICRDLIDQLMGKMILFDFRNGLIRRKYDSLKYQLKAVEDLMYEMSLVSGRNESIDCAEPPSKKFKVDESTASPSTVVEERILVDHESFIKMKTTMEAYDLARENVIKRTRDVQKLSKNAIYSLHRGDIKTSKTQLKEAKDKANAIESSLIKPMPTLRLGGFANALEEYAEAKLFEHWLETKEILLPSAEELSGINNEEYLGGLIDFTGEVGRFAVMAATKRDEKSVQDSLNTNIEIQEAILQITNPPLRLTKKANALEVNTKKLEHVLYELSLAKLTGFNVSKIDQKIVADNGSNEKNEEEGL